MEIKKAKVAKILDSRTLVLNAGSEKGIEKGTKFQIFSSEENVIDPETNLPLGIIQLPKVRVKVVEVQPLFSVAETYEYETINKGGFGYSSRISGFNKMFEPERLVKEYVTFEITDDQKKEISEESSLVKVGDDAQQITESDS